LAVEEEEEEEEEDGDEEEEEAEEVFLAEEVEEGRFFDDDKPPPPAMASSLPDETLRLPEPLALVSPAPASLDAASTVKQGACPRRRVTEGLKGQRRARPRGDIVDAEAMLADNGDFEAGETLLEEEERIVNDDAPPPPLRASCMACVLSSVCWEGQEEV
jgi:hypothetical protein